MVSRTHVSLRADDRSYFAILKKEVHAMAVEAGFSEMKVGEIDIIIAELTSNLVKHADGGNIWVKLIEQHNIQGIEILSVDNGPGMADVGLMTTDGFSTKNTLGHGLGSMKRLADTCQVFSRQGWGTLVLIRVFAEPLPKFIKPLPIEIGSVVLPKPGEQECGDGFFSVLTEDCFKIFLGDGLGHGPEAAAAVVKAGQAFAECEEKDPVEIIRYINTAVKKTRGLVGTVAVFDVPRRVWRLCGVGNIGTRINGPSTAKSYTAYNGIIGLNVANTLHAQQVPYEKGQHLIMCSDGLKSKWDTLKYPGIARFDPTIVAASLIKEYARYTDDMSAVVCKINL